MSFFPTKIAIFHSEICNLNFLNTSRFVCCLGKGRACQHNVSLPHTGSYYSIRIWKLQHSGIWKLLCYFRMYLVSRVPGAQIMDRQYEIYPFMVYVLVLFSPNAKTHLLFKYDCWCLRVEQHLWSIYHDQYVGTHVGTHLRTPWLEAKWLSHWSQDQSGYGSRLSVRRISRILSHPRISNRIFINKGQACSRSSREIGW